MATITAQFDTYDIAEAHYLFWSEYHTGQFSDGYAKLCQAQRIIKPGMMGIRWETMCENAKDIYRNLCDRYSETCTYDTIEGKLEDSWIDKDDDCVAALIKWADNDPESLLSFETSDWANVAESYTYKLLERWESDQRSIKYWFDAYCEAIGATSTLEALEGQTVEDPEDMAAATVNMAMTYCASEILRECFPDR
jgi:hypothetical protein